MNEAAPIILATNAETQPVVMATHSQPDPDDLLFRAVMQFYHVSKTAQICHKTLSTKSEISDFLALCLSNRCKKKKTITETCKNANEYFKFANNKSPSIPYTGDEGVVCLAQWLISIKPRGRTAPRKARYFIRIFGAAMGIDFPTSHPGVIAATRSMNTKSVKHAPPIPLDFIRKVEEYASDPELAWGLRVFCSLICLLVYASLRYADTSSVFKLWKTETAICGLSVNSKDKNGDVMNWATPITGISSCDWSYPLFKILDRNQT